MSTLHDWISITAIPASLIASAMPESILYPRKIVLSKVPRSGSGR
jgi:hypothetical protein